MGGITSRWTCYHFAHSWQVNTKFVKAYNTRCLCKNIKVQHSNLQKFMQLLFAVYKQVWQGPLSNGSFAVVVLNRFNEEKSITMDWAEDAKIPFTNNTSNKIRSSRLLVTQ